jgi:hypothetical protein
MPDIFSPSFVKLQADVEGYLVAQGKREKAKDGFVVFHGYSDALALMFDRYLEEEAFDPLVSHFRAWNWEHSYNDYLLHLTDALLRRRDWPLLRLLWSGVVSKRRRLYNDTRKLERKAPGTVPASSVKASREKLVETLERVRSYSVQIGSAEDAKTYGDMLSRVRAGKMA